MLLQDAFIMLVSHVVGAQIIATKQANFVLIEMLY